MLLFSRALAVLAVVTSLLAAGGCCTIASLFCGPDRSHWVSQNYRTPDDALATLLEAIRRDRPVEIHESLSEQAKDRYGLPGVAEATLAWHRLKEKVTGLHMAGDAVPSAPVREPDGRVRYDLALAGRTLTVRLVEQAFWEVCYTIDDSGEIHRRGRFVDARTLRKILFVQSGDEPGVDAHVTDLLLPELTPAQVREFRVGYAWKVDEMEGISDS